MKPAILAAVVMAALLAPTPAVAAEIRDPIHVRGELQLQHHLTAAQAQETVRTLFRDYLAPAVTDDSKRPVRMTVVRCAVYRDLATCRGWLVTGGVRCRGVFRVWKHSAHFLSSWPRRVVCLGP